LANSLAHSTLLVLACDRKPSYRNETPLYTSPITHEWMDLHKDEIKEILNDGEEWSSLEFAQAVSDLLREKNT
jgi:hypothetical protein